jgi:hypothetical protein
MQSASDGSKGFATAIDIMLVLSTKAIDLEKNYGRTDAARLYGPQFEINASAVAKSEQSKENYGGCFVRK